MALPRTPHGALASAGGTLSVDVTEPHVPSPADESLPTAEEFLLELRARGGRVYRMREVQVFTITNDPEVARWLHSLGASSYMPTGTERALGLPMGAYQRAQGGSPEWDFYIHTVTVDGDETIHTAAGRLARTVDPEEFA